ncbi:molybdopterin-containing oxidoreductase family membrane subunit [Flavobacterium sp. HSC-32F16]|uniref:hypothetical protein n=1 Tax=Flavobacterium sp. HSC-32F16 TaxID=2910964 RepID=UPI0020A3B2F4|nr:hypothetical protein [Flavobacterium sp. HSC-32F16]MCP2028619.1 molybdopterin-containing oxidoreductase family membrane subunit [Flavobacterium sp. HSC-32F16]
MIDNIRLLLQIITVDFFIAFGLYTILYLLISIFIKSPKLSKIDEEVVHFISSAGVVYFLVWIIGLCIFYVESNLEEQISMTNRMFGKYWVGFWLQPILWFVVTQLLRLKKVSKNIFFRVIFSFILIISIERFVIIVISFHGDYLPSFWTMYNDLDIYPSNYLLALLMKIIFFLLCVGIYYLVKNQIIIFTKTKIEN